MSSLTFSAVVFAALVGADGNTTADDSTKKAESSYAEAHKITSETGQPMVVLVGARWCPACVTMKQNVMPQIARRGLFRRCVYTVVDLDEQRELGEKLTSGGPIPQLIMYRKTDDGWRRRKLIGGQSVNNVVRFIDQGIERDEQEKRAKEGDKKASAEEDRQASARHGAPAASNG